MGPLWYFRSDSNITENKYANSLRDLWRYFQDWKELNKQRK